MLTTPENIRTLQRKLYRKAKQEPRKLGECACLAVKNIGKPCAGEPHARFDEGGLVNSVMEKLFRHRQTKEAATDKLILTLVRPALYSTLVHLLLNTPTSPI